MKKLGLSLIAAAAMFFFTENVNAQVEGEVHTDVEMEAHAQEKSDFKEIDVVALPQAVKDAVMTDFNGAVTEEAWVKEKEGKKMYKLSLNVEGEKKKVYADEDGNWIDKKDKEDK
ncbi:hypothetical protein [Salegentibacter sp.]|uniref:hypothetical protein n=1 Tax=Salegentibacter sp. TaxID=1903072 RepID=UPI0035659361